MEDDMSDASGWTVLEVFIASPGNVNAERQAVERAIRNWNNSEGKTLSTILLPRRWEQLSPQQGVKAQHYINRAQVARADILVAFFRGKVGKGTVEEIDLFISFGKAKGAMVYFSTGSRQPELVKLRERLRKKGLTGEFKDSADLAQRVKRDLTQRVKDFNTLQNWPRLKQAVAEIYNNAPYLLARFLTEELLKRPTKEIERVSNEARSFKRDTGYSGYRDAVHKRLKQEKKRGGTKVFAVCGEKGLRNDREALDYFKPFYRFPDLRSKKNQVFRVFVERGAGLSHSPITLDTIAAHEAAERVVPLEVTRQKRKMIENKFPSGLFKALDEGFGMVIFVRRNKNKVVVVHQGVKEDFTYAVFKGKTDVGKILIELTGKLYKESTQYESNPALNQEIETFFDWIVK